MSRTPYAACLVHYDAALLASMLILGVLVQEACEQRHLPRSFYPCHLAKGVSRRTPRTFTKPSSASFPQQPAIAVPLALNIGVPIQASYEQIASPTYTMPSQHVSCSKLTSSCPGRCMSINLYRCHASNVPFEHLPCRPHLVCCSTPPLWKDFEGYTVFKLFVTNKTRLVYSWLQSAVLEQIF